MEAGKLYWNSKMRILGTNSTACDSDVSHNVSEHFKNRVMHSIVSVNNGIWIGLWDKSCKSIPMSWEFSLEMWQMLTITSFLLESWHLRATLKILMRFATNVSDLSFWQLSHNIAQNRESGITVLHRYFHHKGGYSLPITFRIHHLSCSNFYYWSAYDSKLLIVHS